ncbi:unnamed protein product [Heligmosomoides polygyrus]|uniref:LCIB_C_CA domain-containing protein n=1 Tax=Heligmosomoides polygyrus TaxID=6339 RepID=A0A183GQE4_HELPZ|nr:unnamed protein product [Heligmosomoides polygyrus]
MLCRTAVKEDLKERKAEVLAEGAEAGLSIISARQKLCSLPSNSEGVSPTSHNVRSDSEHVPQTLCKLDAISRLKPHAFAGGTVSQILVDDFHSVLRQSIEERLEYGTLNYYAICALAKGFEDMKRYGM